MSVCTTTVSGSEITGTLGDSLSYVQPAGERLVRDLGRPVATGVKAFQREQENLIRPLLHEKTAEAFAKRREQVWPRYLRCAVAIAEVMQATVQADVIVNGNELGIRQLEKDFQAHGPARIGTEATVEMLFILPTARRALRIASMVNGTAPLRAEDHALEMQLRLDYIVALFFAELHCRLVVTMLRTDVHVPPPDVLEATLEGARSVLQMYAAVRQAADLRRLVEVVNLDDALDEEEKQLATFSGRHPWHQSE